jgi:NADH-quinone oxidoreductase subunit J
MSSLVTVVFWVFSGIAVFAAVLCISRRSAVASALWLVVTLFSLAGIFVLLEAQFIAVLQVLVYAGAIMVLFLFVIMLLNLGRAGPTDLRGPIGLAATTILAGVLMLQLRPLGTTEPPASMALPEGALTALQQQQGLVGMVARPLFDTYLIPFEITSLLLLAAVVGAVVLAKRKL